MEVLYEVQYIFRRIQDRYCQTVSRISSQTHKEKCYKGRTRVSFTLEYSILSFFFKK